MHITTLFLHHDIKPQKKVRDDLVTVLHGLWEWNAAIELAAIHL